MKFRFLPFVFFCVTCFFRSFIAKETASGALDFLDNSIGPGNELKILVLIIASDDKPYYVQFQKGWRSYMHLDPDQVESYFIKANPGLEDDFLIDGDVIFSKTIENLIPGILNKTVLSLEALESRLDEFDYVLRTNLSSLYVFPRLLDFLKSAPKKNYYAGVNSSHNGIPFVSGAGILLSSDLAKMLVQHKGELYDQNTDLFDDVFLGKFFSGQKIEGISLDRIEISSCNFDEEDLKNLSDQIFHFRLKCTIEELRNTSEVYLQKELIKRFYRF